MKSTGNSSVFRDARASYREHLRRRRAPADFRQRAAQTLTANAPLLKATAHQRVLRGIGPDSDLVFKFYSDLSPLSLFRPSRARRAFAATQAARAQGIPLAEALGYVEYTTGIAPFTSCLIMRFIPNATTLHHWMRRNHRHLTPEQWTLWRKRLLDFWLNLERSGIYHDDTKTLNILIQTPPDAPTQLWWIDPESVHPGRRPSRRQLLRNLVQLNGSLRSWVPDEQRLLFLQEVAQIHPWLRVPAVEQKIRDWTRQRLLNEIKTRCGP
ncbi:MAG: hypothetical protein J5I99_02695 [Verrucomicrobia bacterium]|nr:hypothetical protein [Kiritimatiellia bacterium]MCO6400124.1 hypothetical protein [Verrucomicrobiota bacterium]